LKVPIIVDAPNDAVNVWGSVGEIAKGPPNVKNVNVQIEPTTLVRRKCVADNPSGATAKSTVPLVPGAGAECVPVYEAPGM
jgi:hypothetical protein